MAKGLKSFLDDWDETHPEDVVVIDEPVSVKYDVAALQHKLESQGLFPVIVYKHPITVEGKNSPFPLVCNLLASRRRCAESIGTRPERVAMDYVKTISARMKPALLANGDAPVKEVIERSRIDLNDLPVPIHHENTSGKEITGSYITTVDPETGIDNTACQRGEPISDKSMSMFIGGGSHNARNIASWWAQGKDAPVAMWIGHHPAACIGGQVKLSHPESHWEAMGGLLREPLRLVPTETWGDLLKVPADAEIVIEGVMPKNKLIAGGQFGDWARYLIPSHPRGTMEVTCITHRRGAYFHDIVTGCADHQVGGSFAIAAAVYSACKKVAPELTNVHLPLSGMCRATVYAQVKNPKPGRAKAIIHTALMTDQRIKTVFVVDDDVDIFDEREVLWAFATRAHFDKDLILLDGVPSTTMNPITRSDGVGTKMGVDCTLPPSPDPDIPSHYQMPMRVPREAVQQIDLGTLVPGDKIKRMVRES
jgi:2,5-furandicarboxylate decarboxylase 1